MSTGGLEKLHLSLRGEYTLHGWILAAPRLQELKVWVGTLRIPGPLTGMTALQRMHLAAQSTFLTLPELSTQGVLAFHLRRDRPQRSLRLRRGDLCKALAWLNHICEGAPSPIPAKPPLSSSQI
jgi:hypothetical protein